MLNWQYFQTPGNDSYVSSEVETLAHFKCWHLLIANPGLGVSYGKPRSSHNTGINTAQYTTFCNLQMFSTPDTAQ